MIWISFLQNQIGFLKIINIGSQGNVEVNEKDISFQKKPEALLPAVFKKLRNNTQIFQRELFAKIGNHALYFLKKGLFDFHF